MTIRQTLARLDAGKYNTCTQSEKIAMLSGLDSMVQRLILDTYGEQPDFGGYDDTTDLDTPLLVPPPFDEIYGYYLESRIDYQNGEYGRYNNSNAMFDAAWQRFADYCNRTRIPRAPGANQFY